MLSNIPPVFPILKHPGFIPPTYEELLENITYTSATIL